MKAFLSTICAIFQVLDNNYLFSWALVLCHQLAHDQGLRASLNSSFHLFCLVSLLRNSLENIQTVPRWLMRVWMVRKCARHCTANRLLWVVWSKDCASQISKIGSLASATMAVGTPIKPSKSAIQKPRGNCEGNRPVRYRIRERFKPS